MTQENSFAKKFITCLVAGLTTIALLLVPGNSGTLKRFPPPVVFSLAGLSFLLAIGYPFVWQQRESKQQIDSSKVYAFLYAIIRYTIAFNLASFGWKKLFGLQFVVPDSIAGKPMNQQSGEWLTWYYFGHSLAFGVLLALIQIIGSFFLLFRKTLLVAAMVLFAFMLNLTLIAVFYGMNTGALIQSVLLTVGIAFLILSDYKRIVQFFLEAQQNSPSVVITNQRLKNTVRLSAILLSLLFVLYLKSL